MAAVVMPPWAASALVRYRTREQARADLFEYIEVFYNRKRRHSYVGNISPDDFERQSTGSF